MTTVHGPERPDPGTAAREVRAQARALVTASLEELTHDIALDDEWSSVWGGDRDDLDRMPAGDATDLAYHYRFTAMFVAEIAAELLLAVGLMASERPEGVEEFKERLWHYIAEAPSPAELREAQADPERERPEQVRAFWALAVRGIGSAFIWPDLAQKLQ